MDPSAPPAPDLEGLFEAQRAAFARNPYPSARERRSHLGALSRWLLENQEGIARSISEDFGHRSTHETRVLEVFPSLEGLRLAERSVKRWMRSEWKPVSLWFQPGRARVVKQPLGVVGIIVPWNYPLYLALGPLASALAAGNRILVKMSEMTPRFGRFFAEGVGRILPPDWVSVVNGGVEVAQAFAKKPFDHLLFTGSTGVGRAVMRAASENLTPVTLELGGKSPAVVAPGYPVDHAARRILYGKLLNAGQTCIAPDYALVPEAGLEAFVAAARDEVARLYPGGVGSPDYTSIISDRHVERLRGYLEDARSKGGAVVELGTPTGEGVRKFVPTIVTGVREGMRLMEEEIFGPVLPVLPYQTLEGAIAQVAGRPRPLAFYYFDRDGARTREVLHRSIAGGVTVNDTIFHIAQDELPFGGVGASGMGHYHGEEGFNTFSKRKGVFLQSRLNAGWLLKPPFGKGIERLLRFLLR
jgi:acyl-CoA reductase-like NAD-dependent aldehyde dehydrogenase